MNNEPKYEYCVFSWGGFFNDENRKIHGRTEGAKYFNSKQMANKYIESIRKEEVHLNAKHLMIVEYEGFFCRTPVNLHRVIEVDGNQYYSSYDMAPVRDYDTALYHLENKWYPGFNDYPLGENFNYDEVKIVQEWISGAFEKNDD